jgi:hypothetical protein
MKPTALMLKMAAKMSNTELCLALISTNDAIKTGGGSINLQGTRWQMLGALKAEVARRAW